MKKSTKKAICRLRRYIGHEVIRTKQTTSGDGSNTYGCPILLVGFTSDGCIRYKHTGFEASVFGDKECTLPVNFTDYNWTTLKKARSARRNPLNKWIGRRIKRVRPTVTGDCSYISPLLPVEGYPILISASKHHVQIMNTDVLLQGRKKVLSPDFANPEDWELAE